MSDNGLLEELVAQLEDHEPQWLVELSTGDTVELHLRDVKFEDNVVKVTFDFDKEGGDI